MHRRLRSWLLGLLPSIALLSSVPAEAAPRLALVIGDAAYPTRPLATTANDAALVAQALAQAGFEVTAARDLDAAGTRAAFSAFADAARAAGPEATILVYLAGYGVQYDDANYLVPVDARLVHDDDVPREAASLDDLAGTLAAIPAKARVLVYDLARANSFATADEMPLADGLALTPARNGTLVAFNAAPGMSAPQAALPYGAYARALAEMIGTPGLDPGTLFDRVRLRVGELTDGTQVPWDDGNVGNQPLLADGKDPQVRTARSIDAIPVDALSPDIAYSAVIARDSLPGYAAFVRAFPDGSTSKRVRTLLAVRREALMWRAAAQSGDPRALWTYMRRYPRGPHLFDARRQLAALHAPLEPPPRFDIVVFPDLPPPSPAELKLVAAPRAAMRDEPPIPSPPAALLQPADAGYYDALPPPAPAPSGLLPIAVPLPHPTRLSGDQGRITQTRPGRGPAVTEMELAEDGGTLTLADTEGLIAEVAARTAANGSRTVLETDAKQAVLSRTTCLPTADGLRMVQTGANGGILYAITTRIDADGERVTRVASGQGDILAIWRRDAQGIVVARDDRPGGPAPQPAPPAPAAPGHGPPLPVPPPDAVRMPPLPPAPLPTRAPAASPPRQPQSGAAEPRVAAPTATPQRPAAPATPQDRAGLVQPAPAPPAARPAVPSVPMPPQANGQPAKRPSGAAVAPVPAPSVETAKPEATQEPGRAAHLPLPPPRPAPAKHAPAPKPRTQASKPKPRGASKHAQESSAKHAAASAKAAPRGGKSRSGSAHGTAGRRH